MYIFTISQRGTLKQKKPSYRLPESGRYQGLYQLLSLNRNFLPRKWMPYQFLIMVRLMLNTWHPCRLI